MSPQCGDQADRAPGQLDRRTPRRRAKLRNSREAGHHSLCGFERGEDLRGPPRRVAGITRPGALRKRGLAKLRRCPAFAPGTRRRPRPGSRARIGTTIPIYDATCLEDRREDTQAARAMFRHLRVERLRLDEVVRGSGEKPGEGANDAGDAERGLDREDAPRFRGHRKNEPRQNHERDSLRPPETTKPSPYRGRARCLICEARSLRGLA